jgi:hypothetical protein
VEVLAGDAPGSAAGSVSDQRRPLDRPEGRAVSVCVSQTGRGATSCFAAPRRPTSSRY